MIRKSTVNRKKKKILISCLAVLIAVVSMISLTTAWFDRTRQTSTGKGFSLENSGKLMGQKAKIETYYKTAGGSWKLITSDYERTEEDGWNQRWDSIVPTLLPAERTEYRTVIKNLTEEPLSVSAYLEDVTVNADLKEYVVIGCESPEEHIYTYESPDFCHGTATGSEAPKAEDNASASLLSLCEGQTLERNASLTVNWYIDVSRKAGGGNFPALAETAEGAAVPVTADSVGECCYWFVNGTDEEGNPTLAYLCDAQGILLTDPAGKYIAYDGSYDGKTVMDHQFGTVGEKISVSGIIVMADWK